jgi:hypothetical protein
MRTIRLETMVGYLAGREGEDAAALRAELADPSSEASRFLESTRLRTWALIEEPPVAIEGPSRSVRHRHRHLPFRAAMVAAVAASILLTAGVALWLGEARLNRLEATLALRETESRADARRIEAALARAIDPPPKAVASPPMPNPRPLPIEQALARVEVGLGRLDRRIEGLDRQSPAPAPPPIIAPEPAPVGVDPAIAEIRREVAALRRELVASDQAGARQVMEIRIALQDVGNLLRMALNRPPMTIPVPIPNNGQNFQNVQPNDLSPQMLSLMGNLGNTHPQTRLESVEQLGRMGQGAQMALPTLHQLLRQETDARVRAATQAAIGSIGSHH